MNGIMARSSAPTFSIWCSAPAARGSLLETWRGHGVGERAVLDLRQEIRFIAFLVSSVTMRGGVVIAELGRVRHRVAHQAEAAPVEQIHDQLQLVQALEVRRNRRVAASVSVSNAAVTRARHRLLAEVVRLGLVLDRRLDDAAR